VAVVEELDVAGSPQTDLTLAGGIVGQELIASTKVARLIDAVVIVTSQDHLVPVIEDRAIFHFQIFLGALGGEPKVADCLIDRHCCFLLLKSSPGVNKPATHEAHPIRVAFLNRRNGVMILLFSAKFLADVLEEAGGGLERIEISIGALSVPDDLYACHGDCLLCFDVYSLPLLYTFVNTFSKIFYDYFL
jgi:hypothetical protein